MQLIVSKGLESLLKEELTSQKYFLWNLEKVLTPSGIENALNAEEINRFSRLTNEAMKLDFLKSRFLLKSLLASVLGTTPKELNFEIETSGRPFLPNSGIDFNFSHSENLLFLGISSSGKIGVDIEKVQHRPSWKKIAAKVTTAEEQGTLLNFGEEEFYQLWTIKEALVKVHGGSMLSDSKKIQLKWTNGWSFERSSIQSSYLEVPKIAAMKYEDFYLASALLS